MRIIYRAIGITLTMWLAKMLAERVLSRAAL